jgi:hypothetical protein
MPFRYGQPLAAIRLKSLDDTFWGAILGELRGKLEPFYNEIGRRLKASASRLKGCKL